MLSEEKPEGSRQRCGGECPYAKMLVEFTSIVTPNRSFKTPKVEHENTGWELRLCLILSTASYQLGDLKETTELQVPVCKMGTVLPTSQEYFKV